MSMAAYMRKIAADDLYLQICKTHADSDSQFGLIDSDRMLSSCRRSFLHEAAGTDLSALPQHLLQPAMRRFLGPGSSYERELCDIFTSMYRSHAEVACVDAAALLRDFAAAVTARTQPPSAADSRALHRAPSRH